MCGGGIVYAGVILYSICEYFGGFGLGWGVEILGFAYGFFLGDFKFKNKIIKIFEMHYVMALIVSFVMSFLLGILYLEFKTIYFWGGFLLKILLGISIISFVIILTYRIKLGNKVNVILGKLSYEVYLIHGLILEALERCSCDMSSGIYIMLAVTMTIAISMPFHMVIYKMSKILKKV